MSELQVLRNADASCYEAWLADEQAGVLSYRESPGQIEFTHTGVPTEFGGKGVASALVEVALADAREQELAVLPTCSFVAAYIERHPESVTG